MSNLHVFGDSFSEYHPGGWCTFLADKLNLKLKSYGVAGSSIEYSFLKLKDTVEKKQLKDNDVVIFVFTNAHRLDLEYSLSVNPIAGIFNKIVALIKQPFVQSLSWVVENQKFIEWYVNNRSEKLLNSKFLLHLGFIRALSYAYPTVKFLAIPAFESSFNLKNLIFKHLSTKTTNLLVISAPCLFEISHAEWHLTSKRKRDKQQEKVNSEFNRDPRINHFSKSNIDILTTSLYEVITLWDETKLNKDSFLKGILDCNIEEVPIKCMN